MNDYFLPMDKQHLPKLDICQNCGTPTPGNFCPECGQDSREHRVALRLLTVGLWNDLFTFDNRFWRSFVILLARPGELTLRYMGGKRARYIPPARMYLFVSIVFFFVLSAVAGIDDGPARVDGTDGAGMVAAAADSLQAEEVDVTGLDGFEAGMVHGVLAGDEFEVEKEALVDTLFDLAPKGMFLLLPLFAGLLALLYWRSDRVFVEHLIFSLHFHTLIFVAFLLDLVVPWEWLDLLVALVPPVYLFLAMKRVYAQSWRKTWLKHFLLVSAYNVVLVVVLATVVGGSIWLTGQAQEHPGWLRWLV